MVRGAAFCLDGWVAVVRRCFLLGVVGGARSCFPLPSFPFCFRCLSRWRWRARCSPSGWFVALVRRRKPCRRGGGGGVASCCLSCRFFSGDCACRRQRHKPPPPPPPPPTNPENHKTKFDKHNGLNAKKKTGAIFPIASSDGGGVARASRRWCPVLLPSVFSAAFLVGRGGAGAWHCLLLALGVGGRWRSAVAFCYG